MAVVERVGDVASVRFSGDLVFTDLFDVAGQLEQLDRINGVLPRLIDAREVTGVGLGFQDMSRFVERLQTFVPDHPVKTAIIANSDVAFGFARMFASLRHDSMFVTQAFRDEQEALAWLGLAV
jgi:hypothetical protein